MFGYSYKFCRSRRKWIVYIQTSAGENAVYRTTERAYAMLAMWMLLR